ncbi:alpha/beta hydrolase fold domain-containing protein [Pseudonocardia xishanensis]|uniref:Alpha/beta hydrolase fold-3 domain-containing protein n=1 Tax=Pseudonocardia xishanensis TaxID=630995 RepID=A0ABP8RSY7_9PSEU
MRLTLPCAAVRAATRLLSSVSLSPRLPLPVARGLLDLQGRVLPVPRGTRTERTPTGLRVRTPGADRDRVVLFLHGGGYLTGSPWSHRSLAAWLSEAAGAPVELLDYRLAPEHPYPAGLDDAEQAYVRLLDAGLPAQRLALAGDSAGAGLAVALLLRLRDKGTPLPATIGLISPWVDLSLTDPHLESHAASDAMLGPELLRAGLRAYLGGRPVPAELRPLEADLSALPPVHVVAGADEVLVGDADRLVARLREAGGTVTYTRSEGMWHDHVTEAGVLDRAHTDLRDLGLALRRDLAARRVRVAVVGAGFGGIGMGVALREDDLGEVTLLEKAERPGGVWRDNTYPGAACDVPSHLYSYSFAQGREWSRRYAVQPDILQYLERVAAEHGLDAVLHTGTEVTDAVWDDAAALWRLATSEGAVEAEALVSACGQLSHPAVPDLPGLDDFIGPAFHSARWDHSVDLRRKRIAVIGTGASAIQFVPEIAREAAQVTVFQRSAAWILPKPDAAYGPRAHRLFSRFPLWHKLSRLGWTAFFEAGALGLTRVRAIAAPFPVVHRALLRRQVADPVLRERLEPDYPVGCKRILFSSDWFRTLARPRVHLTEEKIAEVTPTGVRTADGTLHEADVIVFGTGFRTQDFLAPMRVVGRDGRELSAQWRDGARAHLGVTVPGFPNLFLLYGPNTNVGSGSIVHMLECQIRHAREGIRRLAAGARTVEVRPDAATAYDVEMQSRLGDSVWTECASWYRTETGRITNNWPGTMREYARRTAALDPADYVIG